MDFKEKYNFDLLKYIFPTSFNSDYCIVANFMRRTFKKKKLFSRKLRTYSMRTGIWQKNIEINKHGLIFQTEFVMNSIKTITGTVSCVLYRVWNTLLQNKSVMILIFCIMLILHKENCRGKKISQSIFKILMKF